jgi:hypothetical protein
MITNGLLVLFKISSGVLVGGHVVLSLVAFKWVK